MVVGVACQAIAIALVLQIPLTVAYVVGLPLAAWIIYLTDHVLDVYKNVQTQLSSRHEFVRKHYNYILGLLLLLIATCSFLLFAAQSQQLFFGAISIALLCAAYLVLTFTAPAQWQWLYNKELLVAFVYSAALWIYPVMLFGITTTITWGFFIGCAAAYVNLLMLSIMEQKEDLRQNRFSWVIILGRQRAIHLYNILTITSLFISATAAIHVGQFDFTVLMSCYATNILLHYLLSTKFNSMNHQTIRIISELLFWLPIIILLYKIL